MTDKKRDEYNKLLRESGIPERITHLSTTGASFSTIHFHVYATAMQFGREGANFGKIYKSFPGCRDLQFH
ncbi:hypothetical protein HDV00_002759 [Rhizophlyctis rosea]|nr:hypothetical protein HDV00_002759 [Rhizophlyctis rosea]